MKDLSKEAPLNRALEHGRPGRSFVGVEGTRWGELVLPAPEEQARRPGSGLRVLAVTSYLAGIGMLRALVAAERAHPERFQLVGMCTDDSINSDAKIGLNKRLWRHYTRAERMAIEVETVETALRSGVPVYTGELKIPWFRQQLARWRPDVILVSGCGQLFDRQLLDEPRYGVYNFHPSDLTRGVGAGPQPVSGAIALGETTTRWSVHRMTVQVDAGPIVGVSPLISVGDSDGRVIQDPKRFYDRLRGVDGPMAAILVEELARSDADSISVDETPRIDFEHRLPSDGRAAPGRASVLPSTPGPPDPDSAT